MLYNYCDSKLLRGIKMVALYVTLFLAFSAVSVSYGWGMRGTIIGGEKGAMLPGAFLGISVALFSGSDILSSNPYILAGVGALAMYCGGNMTYADTLDLSMKTSPAPNMKKGIVAIIIKGGIWYGLFGGYVSMFISVKRILQRCKPYCVFRLSAGFRVCFL